MIPLKPRLSPIFFLVISAVITSVHISCTLPGLKPYPNQDLPVYRSQKEIVKQGFTAVPSPYGPIPSVYFGYKRSRNLCKSEYAKDKLCIDIIEYKKLKKDGGWNWKPYLVFVDDNFDGFADRLFLDSNLDGSFEKISNIASESIIINRIAFKGFKPWRRKQPVETPQSGIDPI